MVRSQDLLNQLFVETRGNPWNPWQANTNFVSKTGLGAKRVYSASHLRRMSSSFCSPFTLAAWLGRGVPTAPKRRLFPFTSFYWKKPSGFNWSIEANHTWHDSGEKNTGCYVDFVLTLSDFKSLDQRPEKVLATECQMSCNIMSSHLGDQKNSLQAFIDMFLASLHAICHHLEGWWSQCLPRGHTYTSAWLAVETKKVVILACCYSYSIYSIHDIHLKKDVAFLVR